jgi:hypothetical protein
MAPVALNAAVSPIQITVLLVKAVILGPENTVTETVFELLQPAVAPVTVYVVVIVGLTTTVAPVNEPGFQVYVVAPLPVKVAELPAHIAIGLAIAVTVGIGLTVNVTVFVLVQLPLAPVTVYVVVIVGLTTTAVPVKEPGIHV